MRPTHRSAPADPGVSYLEDFEEDPNKPLLLGYLRRDLLAAGRQVEELERLMTQFARAEGFSMGFTYVEEPTTWPSTFKALIAAVNRYQASAVIVPQLSHLTTSDASFDAKTTFEQETAARLLVLDS